jgi:DNA-binding NarL/FixJ family response regulator
MRILLVDDHPLMSAGLQSALAAALPDAEIMMAAQADDAMALLRGYPQWDLILLDLRIPTLDDGLHVLQIVRQQYSATPVLILSAETAPEVLSTLRTAGAKGFVSKSKGPETLLGAVKIVLGGGEYFPMQQSSGPAVTRPSPRCPELIPRVWQVYHLLAEGMPNKSIGRDLSITEGVVKNYVTRVLDGVGASNRGEAIAIYKENIARWRMDPGYRGGKPPRADGSAAV